LIDGREATDQNPASAAPSKNRSVQKLTRPWMSIIPQAIIPHEIMIREIHRQAPTRTKIRLLGISNKQ
jgi:hypothetical protein